MLQFNRNIFCPYPSAQISGSLDFHTIRIARIVGQRNVLHLDNLNGFAHCTSLHSKRNRFLLCFFEGLLTGEFISFS